MIKILLLALFSVSFALGDSSLCPVSLDKETFLSHPGNCQKYYKCVNGTAFEHYCPTNLYWNQTIEECDHKGNVDCQNGPSPVSQPTTIPDASTTVVPPKNASFCPYPSEQVITYFPYPGDCQKFYECVNGNAFEYDCPTNLYWNQKIFECDYYANVHCEDGPEPTPYYPDESTTVAPGPVPTGDPTCAGFDANVVTLIPYPGDCTKYLECFGGKKNIMPCPPGLFWDNPKKTCDYICVP